MLYVCVVEPNWALIIVVIAHQAALLRHLNLEMSLVLYPWAGRIGSVLEADYAYRLL